MAPRLTSVLTRPWQPRCWAHRRQSDPEGVVAERAWRMLELAQVHTFRGPAHILQGLSLVVHEREVVCLVGRNGAGKTTTIESIMGLLPVRSGHITLQGRDITRLPTHVRAGLGIGYAPEGSAIFPELTEAENLRSEEHTSELQSHSDLVCRRLL